MNNIDVKNGVRRLTDSKPVHAAAGAGAMASQALRDLPARLARWGSDIPVTSLPARASGYARTVGAKAAGGYDMLADRGRKVLGTGTPGKTALNGKARPKSKVTR